MKKLLIAGLLILSFSLTAFAVTKVFTDQDTFASWYASSVFKMKNHGVINGYPDGSFKAGNNVNRAELAVMLDKFAQYMGKPMSETPVACTMQYVYGLTIHVNNQNGYPVTGAQISSQHREGLVSDGSFTESQPGVYTGLGEGEGYYNIKITRAGHADHVETIKLEHDECHVIPQTRTIILPLLPI